MISKEEIEKAKEFLKQEIINSYSEKKAEMLDTIRKYIERLEKGNQKLIEKLEKDIENNYHIKKPYGDQYCCDGVESISTKEYAQEILSILKGETEDDK